MVKIKRIILAIQRPVAGRANQTPWGIKLRIPRFSNESVHFIG